MAAVRREITANPTDAQRFVEGVLALKQESSGITTTDLQIGPGPRSARRALSTYDLFVIWHVWAMAQMSSDGARNAAHMGPVFLPWHRWYLLVLERQMRRVLGLSDDDFAVPYWNWAVDGSALTSAQQRTSAAIWAIIGGDGAASDREVLTGPFTIANGFSIAVEQGPGGQLRATERGLRRAFGAALSGLPGTPDVNAALAQDVYDRPNWDSSSLGFRDRVEGWVPSASAPAMHNRVHVWIGGDMAPGSSPNDPVFFLHHAYVDKIWHDWQNTPGHTYLPTGQSTPGDVLYRHRALDPLYSVLTPSQPQVISMENVTTFYSYD